MRSKVTTKRGDHGETTALSGQSYSKAHPIIACAGAVDEARAHYHAAFDVARDSRA